LIPSVYSKPTLNGDFINEPIGDEAIYLRIAQFEKGLIQKNITLSAGWYWADMAGGGGGGSGSGNPVTTIPGFCQAAVSPMWRFFAKFFKI
jgi:hypothetical protein